MNPSPSYLALHATGELARRAAAAAARLARCDLCARRCGADRTKGAVRAACRTGREAKVDAIAVLDGEEACLSGRRGSGAILFSDCNLRCLYCETWQANCEGRGKTTDPAGLASMMLHLQAQGCHTLNLVSPSHVAAQILEALVLAAEGGLTLPLVWNSGGFDALETLALLDGVVDIYLPDLKYGDDRVARVCSGVQGYVHASRRAVAEMRRQVGDLQLDSEGVARRGLLVRHLVLPGGLAGSQEVLSSLPAGTAVNVMGDYRPCWRAGQHPRLKEAVTAEEVAAVREIACAAGLRLVE